MSAIFKDQPREAHVGAAGLPVPGAPGVQPGLCVSSDLRQPMWLRFLPALDGAVPTLSPGPPRSESLALTGSWGVFAAARAFRCCRWCYLNSTRGCHGARHRRWE